MSKLQYLDGDLINAYMQGQNAYDAGQDSKVNPYYDDEGKIGHFFAWQCGFMDSMAREVEYIKGIVDQLDREVWG